MTGDLEMHPLFLTIANIHSSVCMKATSHAWACIGYIPTPEFLTHSDFHSVLEGHLWHCCLDIIFSGLKVAASVMSIPKYTRRLDFTTGKRVDRGGELLRNAKQ